MTINCRFNNPDCDKALYVCDDCTVILEFIRDCRVSGADVRDITWLGQALDLLEQIVNVNTVKKTAPIVRP